MAPEAAGGSGVAGPVPGGPVVLDYPFQGRWLTQNSPADRVPSHGTTRFALDLSIDLVPVDVRGRTAPIRLRSLLRPEQPTAFPGFGRDVLAPLSGVVHAVHEGEQDHSAMRGIPSLGYALTQGRRAAAGWKALAGNHVILRADGSGSWPQPVFVALCHLRRGSIALRPGQRIGAGSASVPAAIPATAPSPTCTCRRWTPPTRRPRDPDRSPSRTGCRATERSSTSPEERVIGAGPVGHLPDPLIK